MQVHCKSVHGNCIEHISLTTNTFGVKIPTITSSDQKDERGHRYPGLTENCTLPVHMFPATYKFQ